MKVYAVDDLDGLTEAIVAAASIGEAAASLGLSVPQMRTLGWHRVKGATAAVALAAPGRPFYRSIQGGAGRWVADRNAVLARAAKAALRSSQP